MLHVCPFSEFLPETARLKFLTLFTDLRKKYPEKFQVIVTPSEKGAISSSDITLDLGSNTYLLEHVYIEEDDPNGEEK